MSKRSTKRGAPRRQRLRTAQENARLLDELANGRSRAELAQCEAKGGDVESKKQRIYRAIRDGVEIPDDPGRLIDLLDALDDAESVHIVRANDG